MRLLAILGRCALQPGFRRRFVLSRRLEDYLGAGGTLGPGRKPDDAASKTLAGKRVVIKPAEIAGPQAVACKSPRYRLRHYGADILFQGMLDEMRPCDSSVEPLKLARTLGFAARPGRPWRRAAATKSNCISWTRPLPNSVFTTLSTF
jgi:hypothetical protein